MKTLLIILGLSFIYAQPTHAQDGATLAPCLPDGAVSMVWLSADYETARYFNTDQLGDLEGQQVKFLGYAGNTPAQNELEMLGERYGFSGINLYHLEAVGVLTLERDYNDIIGRVEVNYYSPDDTFVISFTTLNQWAAPGSYYDYHILPNPEGGACMWKVQPEDFKELGL